MKYLQQNLRENSCGKASRSIQARRNNVSAKKHFTGDTANKSCNNIITKSLDWETDEVSSSLFGSEDSNKSFDAVIACDCIYNDALIVPLVQTCRDVCQLRNMGRDGVGTEPTVCIIAQQLRSADVFEAWLRAFHKVFHVWRIPDEGLSSDLVSNSGFVIHIGVLR
jgi:hypothetical protein